MATVCESPKELRQMEVTQNQQNAERERCANIALRLAKFIIAYYTSEVSVPPNGKYEKALLNGCRRVEEKHHILLNGSIRKLNITEHSGVERFSQTATSMFQDGIVNWGRIITLYTFAGFVARQMHRCSTALPESEKQQKLEQMQHHVAEYVMTVAGDWITTRGWDDMLHQVRDENDDISFFSKAMLTGGLVVGLAALYRVFNP